MKILVLAPYPLHEAPSQRFRFELFLKFMEQNNVSWDFQSFLLADEWKILYKTGGIAGKVKSVLRGFLRRTSKLSQLGRYQFILIHRELTPFGPPIFEWIIAKVFRKKIIYDFDDAIWMPDQNRENPIWRWLKWRSKVKSICKWSWKVSTGNEYLANYARQYNDQVVVLPTVVDTKIHQPPNAKGQKPKAIPKAFGSQKPTIGWTGSHSTLFYLDEITPILQDLEKEMDFEFLVIANKNPELPLKNFRFIPWNKTTEIEDLCQMNIGIMPLEDTEWSKGKCGFKLIQYLALGIPAVASPVGVNSDIVQEGVTGFLTNSPEEWKIHLKKLLEDKTLRNKLGYNGRKLIDVNFSVESQKEKFLELFH